jgi:hypothetical protein
VNGEVITAVAALVTGVASAIMAWAALTSTRRKADAECQERLRIVRGEAEHAADELHALRMQRALGQ